MATATRSLVRSAALLVALGASLTSASPCVVDERTALTVKGTVRLVVRLESKGTNSYIVDALRANGEFTDQARELRTAEDDKKYGFPGGLYTRTDRSSWRTICGGLTLGTWGRQHGHPIPPVRFSGPGFAQQVLVPFTKGPTSEAPAGGDIVFWSAHPAHANAGGNQHISIVTDLLQNGMMVLETKDGPEATYDLVTPHDPNTLRANDPLRLGYTTAQRYRLPLDLVIHWSYWTPNWTGDKTLDAGVNGIDLTGKWMKEGAPDVSFEITQERQTQKRPLVVRSLDGQRSAVGAFEHGGKLFLSPWNEGPDATLRHLGVYTPDRIEFIADPDMGTKAETWRRMPPEGKALYVGTFYHAYDSPAPGSSGDDGNVVSRTRPATGGREWHWGRYEWMQSSPKTNRARLEIDMATGEVTGQLDYSYAISSSMGTTEFERSIPTKGMRIDPVAYANHSGWAYVPGEGGLSFYRDLGFQPKGMSVGNDFIIVGASTTPAELREGVAHSSTRCFAVLTLTSGGPRPGSRPPKRPATVAALNACGEPAIEVVGLVEEQPSLGTPAAVDGATGVRGPLTRGQVLGGDSLFESKSSRIDLRVTLPGEGALPTRSVDLSLTPGTRFNSGNFIAGTQYLQLVLMSGTAELHDRLALELAARVAVNLSTPRVKIKKVGTHYRVHHDAATEATTVQVYEGEVECTPHGLGASPTRVTAGNQVVIPLNGMPAVTPLVPGAIPGEPVLGPGETGAVPGGEARPLPPLEVSRTLVHHQLTRDGLAGEVFPALSGDGRRVVFAPTAIPCPVQAVDFDGGGRRTLMTTEHRPSSLDLCADGSRALVHVVNRQLFTVSTDGGVPRKLLAMHEPEIVAARLTGDGRKVAFMLSRPVSVESLSAPLADGLWTVPSDGGVPRQVVGHEALRRVLGLRDDEGCAWRACLDVSDDGSRLVFGVVSYGASNLGPKIFTVGGDGSNLRLVDEGSRDNRGHVGSAAITPDGRRVAYMLVSWAGTAYVGLANGDGSGKAVASECKSGAPIAYPDGNSFGDPLTFTADGRWLLLGSTGVLVAGDGSGAHDQLPATRVGGGGRVLLSGGLLRSSMSTDGKRFAYLCGDERNALQFAQLQQLATLEIDPDGLGEAPRITDVVAQPGHLVPGGEALTLCATATCASPIIQTANAVLNEGLSDREVSHAILWDDGQRSGDATASDGVYTSSAIRASAQAELGPRTLRVDCEVKALTSLRHATVLECGPVSVGTSAAVVAGGGETTPAEPGDPRTLAYHQLTIDGIAGEAFPVVSADGSRIVFAPETVPCPLQVIDFDGSGRHTVLETEFRPGELDISADGSRVLAHVASRRLVVADVGGGPVRKLIQMPDPEIVTARLTGDGTQVFFMLGRAAQVTGIAKPLQAGIWSIGVDGGAPRHVTDQAALQRALGLPPNEGCAWRSCLDVSHDGSRLVFGVVSYGATNLGPKIFSVNGDGSGLVLVDEGTKHQYGHVGSGAITPDGRRIAYKIFPWGGVAHVSVADFGGGSVRLVTKCEQGQRVVYPDGNSGGDPLTFTADGRHLMLGSASVLAAVDGSGAVDYLSATRAGAGRVLLSGGLLRASMSADGKRFSFICGDERNPHQFKQFQQLATLELDPRDLGRAPRMSELSVEPEVLVLGKVNLTARTRITTSEQVVCVANIPMVAGMIERKIVAELLYDDGRTYGDEAAGDGLYTCNRIWADPAAEKGAHVMRLDVEIRCADSSRHATAVDAREFVVAAPAGSQ